jgi:hypothetical protein
LIGKRARSEFKEVNIKEKKNIEENKNLIKMNREIWNAIFDETLNDNKSC